MTSRNWWRVAFLGLTTLVLGMELWAGFDGNASTDPWTDMLVAYVPAEVVFAAIGALALWLPVHFGIRYVRKHRAERSADDTP